MRPDARLVLIGWLFAASNLFILVLFVYPAPWIPNSVFRLAGYPGLWPRGLALLLPVHPVCQAIQMGLLVLGAAAGLGMALGKDRVAVPFFCLLNTLEIGAMALFLAGLAAGFFKFDPDVFYKLYDYLIPLGISIGYVLAVRQAK